MKRNTFMIFSIFLPGLFELGSANALPGGAVERIGFSKRQDQWIGGGALYATSCPSDLQNCGSTTAQRWCCPKDTVCVREYCCPDDEQCGTIVRTFPSCTNPSWTLCSFDYFGTAHYFCCQPGEQCYLASGNVPACGPGSLPVSGTQALSTVSPSYTRSAVGTSVSAESSVSPQSFLSSSYSSTIVLSSESQVVPSITRSSGSGISTAGSSQTSVAAGGAQNSGTSDGSGSNTASSGSSGLSGGAIAGIVVGAVIGLALIALVGICGARYGSRKAIERYTAAATANVAPAPPMYNTPEGPPVFKPEINPQAHEAASYYTLPREHVELGADHTRG